MMTSIRKSIDNYALIISRSSLARGGLSLAATQYLSAAIGFGITIFVTRWLGPNDFGKAAIVMSYPSLLWSFLSFKPVSVTTRYISGFRETGRWDDLKAVIRWGYGVDVGLSILTLILVSLTAGWVSSHFLGLPEFAWLMVAYASAFPLMALAGNSWAILLSWERFSLCAFFQVMPALLEIVLIVIAFFMNAGVVGFVLARAAALAASGLGMMMVASLILRREGLGDWWKKQSGQVIFHWRTKFAKLLGWNYLLVTLSGLVDQLPVMFLGRFRGPEEAGFYRLATSLMVASTYLQSSAGKVVYPRLSQWQEIGAVELIKGSLKRWTIWAGLPMFGVLLFVVLLLPVLVPFVFGSQYKPAILGAQMMIASVSVSSLFFWLNPLFYAYKRVNVWVKGYLLYALAVIALGWFMSQKWGFVGISAFVAIGNVLFTLSMLALVKAGGLWRDDGRMPSGR